MPDIITAIRPSTARLVLSIDSPRLDPAFISDIMEGTSDFIPAYKFGLPFLVRQGSRTVKSLITRVEGPYYIADLKLADIGDIMAWAAEVAKYSGFHGITAHAAVGIEGGLDRLMDVAKDLSLDLIHHVTLSNSGARETLSVLTPQLKQVVNALRPSAVFIPGSMPDVIRDFRTTFGNSILILAPVSVISGMSPGEALCAGADAEVFGRAIINSPDPIATARKIADAQIKYLRDNLSRCWEGVVGIV